MLMFLIRKEKGITLIEILAAVAIMTVIGVVTLPLVARTFHDFQEGAERSKLFKEAQKIEAELLYAVRNTATIPDQDSYLKLSGSDSYSFYSSEDQTETYFFELDGSHLTYTKGSTSFVLSEHVAEFSLDEEGDKVKKLIYTIRLESEVNGQVISVAYENRYIYFPIWDL